MMIDENVARLRAHSNNISRYRRLLRTQLTALERDFIEQSLIILKNRRGAARAGVTHRGVLVPDRHAAEEDEPCEGDRTSATVSRTVNVDLGCSRFGLP